MGLYISTGYGSVGFVDSDVAWDEWRSKESAITALAKNHGVHVNLKSHDQGNEGEYLVVTANSLSYEHIYQDSIFLADLGVNKDPEFEEKFNRFVQELQQNKDLGCFSEIQFSDIQPLLFT